MVCRDSRRRASDAVEIEDALTAFEFDAVCSYLLQAHDNKREAERLKVQLQANAVMWGADPSKFKDDETEDDDI